MTYTPKLGSIAAKAIDVLTEERSLPIAVLADRLGLVESLLLSCLAPAVNHGLVKHERDRATGLWVFRLGDGAPTRPVQGDGFPTQRIVDAADVSPGVDIDAIHASRPWRELLPEARDDFLCALEDSCLRLTRDGRDLLLTYAQTLAVRKLFAEFP